MPKTAEIIVSLRKKNGITQEKLAEMLLVYRSLVSLWELGRRMPDYSSVLRMASIFDVSAADIVSGEEYLYCAQSEQNIFFKEIDEITQHTGALSGNGNMENIINDFFSCLTKKNKDIFVNRYYFAKTTKAIAFDFNMSESSVKVRLTRMRKKLKRIILRRIGNDK